MKLAGNSLPAFPFFEFVIAFNQGSTIEVAVDPSRYPAVIGQTADLYLVAHKSAAEWTADPSLTDVHSPTVLIDGHRFRFRRGFRELRAPLLPLLDLVLVSDHQV